MKVGILAFGRAGCRLADRIQRFDIRTAHTITKFVMACDTAQADLDELRYIDEDEQSLFGEKEYDGLGTESIIPKITSVSERLVSDLKTTLSQRRVNDIDAFLILGSLGGGTGGATMSVCTNMLSKEYTNTPIYSVGVLPALVEADIYTVNAAKTVQSVANASDNLILIDNEKLGLVHPKWNTTVDGGTDPEKVFKKPNEEIARCIHMLLSSDEYEEQGKLKGTIAQKQEIQKVLATGGLSTFGYAAKKLPRAARPGIINRFYEAAAYMKAKTRDNSNRESENTSTETDENASEPDTSDVNNNVFERDWPHPAKLLPETLNTESVMIDINPKQCERVMYLFAGPKKMLDRKSLGKSADWVEQHSNAGQMLVKNYPVKHKKVATLTVNSGIGIPKRIQDMQYIADDIINGEGETPAPTIDSDIKATGRDVFAETETLPPAI